MKTRKHLYIGIIIVLVILAGIAGGRIYCLFFSKPFQLSDTQYLYIDADDNIDSVYHQINIIGKPKSMKGFRILAEKEDYANHIKTGKYAIKPTDNMRYLHRRLALGYQTPVNITVGSVRSLDRISRNIGKQLMIDSVDIAQLLTDTAYIHSFFVIP